MLRLTDKYEPEDEIQRQNRRICILEADNERLTNHAAVMCRKTFDLLRALNWPEEEILRFYKETK